jgi:hypothetical protein
VEKEEKIMNRIFLKFVAICGFLLLSFVQANGDRDNPSVEAHIDLIQNGNQITVLGEVTSTIDTTGVKIEGYIFRPDRSLVYTLLDSTANLQATNTMIIKDLNNGEDITFSMEYLYGKYVVVLEISGGCPLLETVRMEKDFQTELIFLDENMPVDILDGAPASQQNLYDLPCCSLKVAEDLNEYFGFNWTAEQIKLAAEKIESEIYPNYSQGFSDLKSFLNDLNTILEMNLTQVQIDELIYVLENGLFSPKTDAPLPEVLDEITEMIKHPSDSSAPFLTGKNVIVSIYVNDPNNTWNVDDRNTAWQQILTASDHILNCASSSANVSFIHVSFVTFLNEIPDYSHENPNKDWMEKAVDEMHYSSADELAKAIKTTYNADHIVLLFLPHTNGRSYALPYPVRYGERACVFFYASCFIVCIRNDEGPYKHETLHLYGACDEYYDSHCNYGCGECAVTYDNYKSLYLNSGNCEYCMSNPVPCVMRSGANNDHAMNDYICDYTRGQIGWGDYDGDIILDPFDLCPANYGPSSNYGCPSFGMADVPSLFASDNLHVVGDTAYVQMF